MNANRILKIRTPSGVQDLPIRLSDPEGFGNKWYCSYEIGWPEGVSLMRAPGSDGIQALSNALCMIGADLYTSDYHKDGDILFWEGWKGYGFPVPGGIRDLLIGNDAEFF